MPSQLSPRCSKIERYLPTRNGNDKPNQSVSETQRRTQGEIEADVCEVLRRYSLEYMGRGPKEVRTYLLDDLLLVRLSGILTVAEQHLAAKSIEKGKDLLKQVRIQLVEMARNEMEAMIRVCTGVEVISLHHDISTVTGEEVILFTLNKSPLFRLPKKK